MWAEKVVPTPWYFLSDYCVTTTYNPNIPIIIRLCVLASRDFARFFQPFVQELRGPSGYTPRGFTSSPERMVSSLVCNGRSDEECDGAGSQLLP